MSLYAPSPSSFRPVRPWHGLATELLSARPARVLLCALGGVVLTLLLFLAGFLSTAVSRPPALDQLTKGTRLTEVPAPDREEQRNEPVLAELQPQVPRMKFTPDLNVELDVPPLQTHYAVNPNITVGVAVPAPPAYAPPAAAAPAVFTAGELDARPAIRYAPTPDYPAKAKQESREGRVVVRVVIDAEGRVLRSRIVPGPDSELFGAATLTAVNRWRFTPGERGGRKVTCEVEIPVVFTLDR